MFWAWALGVWAVLSVPVAVVLSRLTLNGHRHDPRPPSDDADLDFRTRSRR